MGSRLLLLCRTLFLGSGITPCSFSPGATPRNYVIGWIGDTVTATAAEGTCVQSRMSDWRARIIMTGVAGVSCGERGGSVCGRGRPGSRCREHGEGETGIRRVWRVGDVQGGRKRGRIVCQVEDSDLLSGLALWKNQVSRPQSVAGLR